MPVVTTCPISSSFRRHAYCIVGKTRDFPDLCAVESHLHCLTTDDLTWTSFHTKHCPSRDIGFSSSSFFSTTCNESIIFMTVVGYIRVQRCTDWRYCILVLIYACIIDVHACIKTQ